MKTRITPPLAAAAILAAYGVVASTSNAQATLTWTSNAAAGANWSLGDNWAGDVAPVAGDNLTFNIPVSGGTRTVNNDFAANTQFGNIVVNANAFVMNGNVINLGGNYSFAAGGASTFTNSVNMGVNLVQNVDISVSAGTAVSRIDWNGVISGSFGINKIGPGVLRFQTNAKTYTGDTTVSAGTLDINLANALPNGAGAGNLVIQSPGITALRQSQNINGLSGSGTLRSETSGTKTVTLGNGDASADFTGSIINNTGAVAITKVGTGTQIISGTTNTYTGATTVNGGTLQVDGSLGTTATTVGVNGTLAGKGTLAGTATVNGTLRPDSTPANATDRLTFSNTLTLAGLTQFDINAGNFTGVNASATTNLGGNLSVNFIGGVLPGTYDLFSFTGSVAGGFLNVDITGIGALLENAGVWSNSFGQYAYEFSTTTGDLVVSAIPEPSTWAAIAGVLALGVALRRRRS